MRKRTKRILSLCLSVLMALNAGTAAMANDIGTAGGGATSQVLANIEATTFLVSVPTALVVTVDALGQSVAATEAAIVNNSVGPVRVTNVTVTGTNGWETIDYDSADMSTTKVNSKKIAFEIRGDKTTGADANTFTQDNWPAISGVKDDVSSELPITYSAKVPAQRDALSGIQVADVVFTIDWDSEGSGDTDPTVLKVGDALPEGAYLGKQLWGGIPVGELSTNSGLFDDFYEAGDAIPEMVVGNAKDEDTAGYILQYNGYEYGLNVEPIMTNSSYLYYPNEYCWADSNAGNETWIAIRTTLFSVGEPYTSIGGIAVTEVNPEYPITFTLPEDTYVLEDPWEDVPLGTDLVNYEGDYGYLYSGGDEFGAEEGYIYIFQYNGWEYGFHVGFDQTRKMWTVDDGGDDSWIAVKTASAVGDAYTGIGGFGVSSVIDISEAA